MNPETLLRKHVPPNRTLITFGTSPSGANRTVVFRLPIPDSRLRVKVTIIFIPIAGTAVTINATLWVYEAELDTSGVMGSLIPTTNIEGTDAAPTTLPIAAGLQGYSREFVSAGDYIVGRLVSGPQSQAGSWVMQTRYQPDSVRFTDDEWTRIISQCNPDLSVGPIVDP